MSEESAHYIVLGDVVESRHIPRRGAFGTDLTAVLAEVNATYAESIHAEFESIRGIDEIGGVLEDVRHGYEIVRSVNFALHPTAVRFVIVRGPIDVNVESRRVSMMDGPAFHTANDRLRGLEANALFFDLDTGIDERVDRLIANHVNLMYLLWAGWTTKQIEALEAYRAFETQAAAARELDITQQTLSERLQAINWRQILVLEERLTGCLAEYERTNRR